MNTSTPGQNVLAVDRAYVKTYMSEDEGVFSNTLAHFARTSERQLIIKDREALIADHLYTAILVHVILRIKGENGLLYYCSFRKGITDPNEPPSKVGIGLSGYIDLADINIQSFRQKGHIELFRSVANTVERVLMRGVLVTDQTGSQLVGFERFTTPAGFFVADARKKLVATNLAMVLLGDFPHTFTVSARDSIIETLPLMTAAELLESGLPLNRWTHLCLEKLTRPK